MYFFFFKQKTAYEIKECDWSSDVCSSDLFLFLTRNAADKADSLIVADSAFFSADKRYYLFVYGNPDVFSVYRNEVESLPIRSIYE